MQQKEPQRARVASEPCRGVLLYVYLPALKKIATSAADSDCYSLAVRNMLSKQTEGMNMAAA